MLKPHVEGAALVADFFLQQLKSWTGSSEEKASASFASLDSSVFAETKSTKAPIPDDAGLTEVVQPLRSDWKEESVPSSRLERVAGFGQLGVGLAMGTVGEILRRGAGLSNSEQLGGAKGLVLTKSNTDRVALTLCKMRGAALKLGQMLSLQVSVCSVGRIQKNPGEN